MGDEWNLHIFQSEDMKLWYFDLHHLSFLQTSGESPLFRADSVTHKRERVVVHFPKINDDDEGHFLLFFQIFFGWVRSETSFRKGGLNPS